MQNNSEKFSLKDEGEVLAMLQGGNASIAVELVNINGRKLIRKKTTPQHAASESFFYKRLLENNTPTLELYDTNVKEGLLLIEYIEDSPNLFKYKTSENFRLWGKVVRQVHSIQQEPLRFTENGEKENVSWSNFLKEELEKIKEKAKNNKEKVIVERASEVISDRLFKIKDLSPVLLHGDLHIGNALVRRNEILLFDNTELVNAGNTLYDLALIVINLPEKIFGEFSEKENKGHFLEDFVAGYGQNWPEGEELRDLYVYTIFRALQRHPNTYEPHLLSLVERILQVISF